MTKNYVGFVNDHSGSMASLARAATNDYNANITAVKDAASREMLDTVVSVVGVGIGNNGYGVKRQVVISNPHVLKPVDKWSTDGGTPLYDGVADMIDLFQSLPDYQNPDVSFLVVVTTDGEEAHSTKYNKQTLAKKIQEVQKSGRWTLVFRVPKGYRNKLDGLNIPLDNIQEWETSVAGMAKSTAATTQAMDNYYSTRSAGAKSTGVFYANAANVSQATVKAALVDISAELNMWTVLPEEDGTEIKPFSEKRLNGPLLKGAAFYQLTKTEARVQDTKTILIRDKTTGRVYYGLAARQMIGLPDTGTVRLKVGDHGNYDIFIQSTSTNRKLVAGSQVVYWAKVGSVFQEDDEPYLKPKQAPQAVPQATASVMPVTMPSGSKVPQKASNSPLYFPTRDLARAAKKGVVKDAGPQAPSGKRWYI